MLAVGNTDQLNQVLVSLRQIKNVLEVDRES